MRLPSVVTLRLASYFRRRYTERRAPDFVVGGKVRESAFRVGKDDRWTDGYLDRWWTVPRNILANAYLHQIWRSDPDRALHDHPWFSLSIVLERGYWEMRIKAGGVEVWKFYPPGSIIFRTPWAAHRLVLASDPPAMTLFLTGPRIRPWGLHCPQAGWRHWKDFTDPADKGAIGRGCD